MASKPSGLSDAQYWLLIALGVIALVLVCVNIATALSNKALRVDVTERRQYIDQSVQLGRFNKQLAQSLATLAVKTGDDALEALLNKHGVDITVRASADAAPAGDQLGGRQ
ncbi:MAG: hypothetical protein LJE69_15885 [Thiohalocapsa sp.]|jgi:hypothetical protein|uniref:hypothetical protein n=1 Tax=Thiohalocapsa sp. TaxID=2497641 RepID=UPI0025E1E320|nr:hypothetical protein [Thiohalocapsa sp.]MCG6942720.1 hypothetical protein [Thiohalocapsa sp.]